LDEREKIRRTGAARADYFLMKNSILTPASSITS
jgi:hypothetical protein